MKELGIKGDERLICFGQLLGMCDNLTFPLGIIESFHNRLLILLQIVRVTN